MFPRKMLIVFLLVVAMPAAGAAQSLTDRLSTLLTAQVPTSTFVPDVPAAEATRDTVARLFAIELTSLPVASSSGGFVYRLNPTIGAVERASESFGPFFTERTLRNGRGQMSFGFSFQFSSFSSLQGAELDTGTFPTNAARLAGATQPFSVDTLRLSLESRTTVAFASYGVTDRFAIGGTVPFVTVQFDGTRVRNADGTRTLQAYQSGSASGLGDITLNARYLVAGDGPRGFTLGTDVRMPTGHEEDLLGSGRAAARFLVIGSWEDGTLAVNLNGGYGVGGASSQLTWGMATTFAAAPRVTLVGEIIGTRIEDLSYVEDVYQPHPLVPGVETMRWLDADRGVVTAVVVAGAKWNIASTWLLNTSLLFRVTDGGLRGRVTPAISLGYDFER
ncbi:MAG: hypothetical protein ACRD2X_01840 [Vicinamibacteraceae bacterium]